VNTLQLNRPGVVNLRRVLLGTGHHPPQQRWVVPNLSSYSPIRNTLHPLNL
jgi:hypothetical protein